MISFCNKIQIQSGAHLTNDGKYILLIKIAGYQKHICVNLYHKKILPESMATKVNFL